MNFPKNCRFGDRTESWRSDEVDTKRRVVCHASASYIAPGGASNSTLSVSLTHSVTASSDRGVTSRSPERTAR